MAKNGNKTTATERRYGYEFGVDGLMSGKETQAFLGGVSRTTVYRLAVDGKIRQGNAGRAYFCRRSVTEYARSIEG